MTRDEWLKQEIQGFRKKIELFQAFIAEYERELGVPGTPTYQPQPIKALGKQQESSGDDPLAWISGMIFFNKTQPDAAKMVLERVGYPLKTEQLIDAIEKGGVKVGGKTEAAKKQNFYTILNRNPEFGRAAPDTWGLAGWSGIPKRTPNGDPEVESI
jgi:hypothetical protein